MPIAPNTWFRIRMVCYGFYLLLGAVTGYLEPRFHPELPPTLLWHFGLASILSVLLLPFMVAVVISFQAINPWSAKIWTRPTHHVNPLNMRNPLLFFHFAAYLFIAGGTGMLVSSAACMSVFAAAHGGLIILGGGGVLVGVRLAMRWCRKKMQVTTPLSEE